jgi:hypothetical protein
LQRSVTVPTIVGAIILGIGFIAVLTFGPWRVEYNVVILTLLGGGVTGLLGFVFRDRFATKISGNPQDVEVKPRSIESGFITITIDTTPLMDKKGKSWTATYSRSSSFGDLLSAIWLNYLPHDRIKRGTYGKSWRIKDADSDTVFFPISEKKSLAEVGINSGMKLQVIRGF